MEDESAPLIRNNNSVMNDDMKHMIMERIRQSYEKDINENLESRSRCRKLGNVLQTFSQFISVGATILAFSAEFYDDRDVVICIRMSRFIIIGILKNI